MSCSDNVIQRKENPRICFSQMMTLFKLKNHYTAQRPPVPSPVLLEVQKCCVTKKITKIIYLVTWIISELFSFFFCLHSKMWNTS